MASRVRAALGMVLVGILALCIGAINDGRFVIRQVVFEDVPYTFLMSTASFMALWSGFAKTRLAMRIWMFLAGTTVLILLASYVVPRLYFQYYVDVGTIHAVVAVVGCLIWRRVYVSSWNAFFGPLFVRDLLMWTTSIAVLIAICQLTDRQIVFDPETWDYAVMLRGVCFAIVPLAVVAAFTFFSRIILRTIFLVSMIPTTGMLLSAGEWLVAPSRAYVFQYPLWFVGLASAQACVLCATLILTKLRFRSTLVSDD